MTTESDFKTFLENAIWDRTGENEKDEEGKILSNDNSFVVIYPDKLL